MLKEEIEVDLLYKETNNQTVYVVETFKRDSDIWNANEFNIQSEIISSVVPSNQLLRSYDNVPCLLYTSPSPRDRQKSRMPSSA